MPRPPRALKIPHARGHEHTILTGLAERAHEDAGSVPEFPKTIRVGVSTASDIAIVATAYSIEPGSPRTLFTCTSRSPARGGATPAWRHHARATRPWPGLAWPARHGTTDSMLDS